jgi:hypothetical protein
MSNVWSNIIIEGYCLIDIDYDTKKSKYWYRLKENHEFEKEKNPMYKKGVKKPPTPKFCKERGHPCYHCMQHTCPHFAFSEAREGLVIFDPIAIKEEFEELIQDVQSE